MPKMTFDEVIGLSKRFSTEQYVTNFGGMVEEMAALNDSPHNRNALRQAREMIEREGEKPLPNGIVKLQRFDFGNHDNAPELFLGEVAAVDGTYLLPIQKNTSGTLIAVGVVSNSYKRQAEESLHGYSTKHVLSEIDPSDSQTYIQTLEKELSSIFPTAYMRYFEALHAIEIEEKYVLCDGTLVTEWLANTSVGRSVYVELLGNKKPIGVMKSLKDNKKFGIMGRVLKPGELLVYETLYDHLEARAMAKQNGGPDRTMAWRSDAAFDNVAKKVWRGIFKPGSKTFGFECHEDHMSDMLRIMAADVFIENPGHEIPFLLHQVDQVARKGFAGTPLQNALQDSLSISGDDLFFDESDEHDFR